MCELLGMSANVPTDICFSFAGLIRRGGDTGPHGDGWGVAFYDGKGCRAFLKPRSCVGGESGGRPHPLPLKGLKPTAVGR